MNFVVVNGSTLRKAGGKYAGLVVGKTGAQVPQILFELSMKLTLAYCKAWIVIEASEKWSFRCQMCIDL